MSTKYELQAELRALNRGMKALPISKMKKHELEHSIDVMKKLKIEKAETPMGAPAKAGRPLSRPIVSENVVDDDLTLHVPKPLKERAVEKRSAPKKDLSLFPGVTKRAAQTVEARKKLFVANVVSNVVSNVVDEGHSDEEMTKKVRKLQKSGDDHTHNCNCEGCPKKGKFVAFD